ncbi:helix-turn-helix domain-containing protein [Tumebacillus flagellatus]|uniref:HTH cro/C1-type domain-containing protein n=1 Tax=Tumebacillus flagellatus TaxID=1157490 RepID=A0A074LIE4_9BACL|nr:helix-turn-helix transcriptional regulator [Tumebacillus flagellatus]KEO80909.1 hypothetical protein EL26_23670 [Tumebacillus flagellatus]
MLLDSSMTIGQRFKIIRTEKGFSQSELAEGLCSQTVVSLIEHDKKYPSAEMWGKLAERLGVPLREIMGIQESQMEANFQIDMIRVYIEKGDFYHALELIDGLDQQEDLLEHQRADLLISRSEVLVKTKKYDEAVHVLSPFVDQQGVQQTVGDDILCALHNKLGTAYFQLRDFEKAYSSYENGYRVSKKLPGFGLLGARVAYNMGITCNQLGFKGDGRRYLQEAYDFYNSTSQMNKLADTLFALAMATGNVEYLTKARSIYEGLNLTREANIAIQHFAFYVESQVDTQEALRKFDASIEAFHKCEDIGMCVYTSARAAIVCMTQNKIQNAEKYLTQAEQYKVLLKEENEYLLADFFRAKAMYNLRKENYDQCILDSQTASEMCDKMGLHAESAYNLEISAEALHKKGEHESAYLLSKKALDMLRPRRGV